MLLIVGMVQFLDPPGRVKRKALLLLLLPWPTIGLLILAASHFFVMKRGSVNLMFPAAFVGLATLERHGGRVWTQGRPGAGATFSFSLPKLA